jgi:hypothetical protein
MSFNHRTGPRLEDDEALAFMAKQLIGRVRMEVLDSGRMREICNRVPSPAKQFDGLKRVFPRRKLRMRREWVHEVVELLGSDGILEETVSEEKVGG